MSADAALVISSLLYASASLTAVLSGLHADEDGGRVAADVVPDRVMALVHLGSALAVSVGSFGWGTEPDFSRAWLHLWVVALALAAAGFAAAVRWRRSVYGRNLSLLATWTTATAAAAFTFVTTMETGPSVFCLAAVLHAVAGVATALARYAPHEAVLDALLQDDTAMAAGMHRAALGRLSP